MNPIVTIYDRETEAALSGFFEQWDGKYQAVRDENQGG